MRAARILTTLVIFALAWNVGHGQAPKPNAMPARHAPDPPAAVDPPADPPNLAAPVAHAVALKPETVMALKQLKAEGEQFMSDMVEMQKAIAVDYPGYRLDPRTLTVVQNSPQQQPKKETPNAAGPTSSQAPHPPS